MSNLNISEEDASYLTSISSDLRSKELSRFSFITKLWNFYCDVRECVSKLTPNITPLSSVHYFKCQIGVVKNNRHTEQLELKELIILSQFIQQNVLTCEVL
jgi:hypothetical protein